MSEEGPRCPRCGEELEMAEILGVAVDRCPNRHGVLVEQKNMIPLTQSLAEAVAGSFDPYETIEAVPDDHGKAPCPDCGVAMTRFGYMETRLVTLDRCSTCWVVWIDEPELEPMIRLTARTLGRAREKEAELHELERHLSALLWSSGDTSGFHTDLLLSSEARLASVKFEPPSRY